MGIEYELKFKATPEAFASLIARYGGQAVRYEMATTYYDTPSGGLSARHYTLRRRMENSESVCTLKTPASGFGRQELEIPCQDIGDAIPLFAAAGAPADFARIVQEGILPVCSAKFTRLAVALSFGDSRLELAMDQGFLTGGDRTIPLMEVEVELKEGDKKDADLFALTLADEYGLVQESASKFRRALALYKGESL